MNNVLLCGVLVSQGCFNKITGCVAYTIDTYFLTVLGSKIKLPSGLGSLMASFWLADGHLLAVFSFGLFSSWWETWQCAGKHSAEEGAESSPSGLADNRKRPGFKHLKLQRPPPMIHFL